MKIKYLFILLFLGFLNLGVSSDQFASYGDSPGRVITFINDTGCNTIVSFQCFNLEYVIPIPVVKDISLKPHTEYKLPVSCHWSGKQAAAKGDSLASSVFFLSRKVQTNDTWKVSKLNP